MINFMANADIGGIAIDGANGQQILASDMREAGNKEKACHANCKRYNCIQSAF